MKRLDKVNVKVRLEEVPYETPENFFERQTEGGSHIGLLLESRRKELKYGARTVAVTKPGLQFIGKGSSFEIIALNEAGRSVLGIVAEGLEGTEGVKSDCLDDKIAGVIERQQITLPEHLRIRQPGLGSIMRQLLSTFNIDDPDAGLYGAFAYDYVRQGESIGTRFASGGGADVNLLLPFELVAFDEERGTAVRKTYGFSQIAAESAISRLSYGKYHGTSTDMTDGEYMRGVGKIVSDIAAGEMIQVILSRTVKTGLVEHPFESYKRLAEINPSPYCLFFNIGNDESLFGASPETYVKIEKGVAELRPLAGTKRRTGNAVDDHYVRQELLNDEKERREHVMLVDLTRHDLSRVCKQVRVAMFMETVAFQNIYHLESSVTGQLMEGRDALDVILTTLPQGTLSGAPKVRAMQEVEELEGSRRGYYGGCFGMLGFNGDCNTSITIRTVNTKGGYGYARTGAGIVLLSQPERELAEVKLKAENQLRALRWEK